jgi:cytochrome c
MKLILLLPALLLTAPAQAQDSARGQAVFKRSCAACHSVDATKPKAMAPTLAGVVGRKGGTLASARYSAAMKKAAPVWSAATLESYLSNPKSVVPGGYMLVKLARPDERRDVIAYLKSLK